MKKFTASSLAVVILLGTACTRSPQVRQEAARPAPPVEPPLATLAEALEARKQNRTELFERSLVNLTASSDPVTARRAAAILAMHHAAAKQPNAAAELRAVAATYAAGELAAVAPYLLLHAAASERQSGRPAAALVSAREILQLHPSSPAAADAQLLVALAARETSDPQAAEELRRAMALAVDELTEPRFVDIAETIAASGDNAAANELRLHILRNYPQGRAAEKLYAALVADDVATGVFSRLTAKEMIELADRLGRFNRYDQALDLLARVKARFPDAESSSDYRSTLATALFNSRRYPDVTALTAAPDDPNSSSIELLRARAFWRDDRPADFVALAKKLTTSPDVKIATAAKLQLSKYYLVDGRDPAAAASYLRQVIDAGGAGSDGENLWNLGWIHIAAGDHEEAIKVLDEYLRAYPDADYTTNSLFWKAKSLGRLGRIDEQNATFRELIDRYPYSYFTYRARQITGAPLKPEPSPMAAPFPSLTLTPEQSQRVAVIDELREIGLATDAARELKTVMSTDGESQALAFKLADLYADTGEPLKAIALLQRRFRDVIRRGAPDAPRRFWEILYPRHHWTAIEQAARRSGVDPWLIPSIIRQESGWEPTTVSSAGAVGIMQIMPQEAARIAQDAGLQSVTRADLFDAEKNIAIGAAEISQKLKAMRGNEIHAIAAYNAGEEAVGRWLAAFTAGDIDVFVESIPFNETRLYVKNVIRNRFEYRRIYESPQLSSN